MKATLLRRRGEMLIKQGSGLLSVKNSVEKLRFVKSIFTTTMQYLIELVVYSD